MLAHIQEANVCLEGVLQEANVLAHIQQSMEELEEVAGRRSQFVVNFFGFCHLLPDVCIVLEHCNGGDLMHRLRRMQGQPTTASCRVPIVLQRTVLLINGSIILQRTEG